MQRRVDDQAPNAVSLPDESVRSWSHRDAIGLNEMLPIPPMRAYQMGSNPVGIIPLERLGRPIIKGSRPDRRYAQSNLDF